MSEWFEIAYQFVRRIEGKYSNYKEDRGGETQYGISTPAFIDAKKKGLIPESYQSVKELTPDDAKRIYKSMYWDAIQGDKIAEIDPRLAIALFDFYINSGDYAVKKLQKIINSNNDGIVGPKTLEAIKEYVDKYGKDKLLEEFLSARKQYYQNIIKVKPDQQKFLQGWLNRIERLKNFLYSPEFSDYANKVRRNVQEGSRRIDPLVIDLDGDGIKLVNINQSNAMFDLTGSGFANKTGWISSGDAFLVWDKNNNGRIDDISEMFGSGNQSGFKALALYDTNRDGKIDAFDDVFKNLKLWQDRNGDGRTDEGELLSLRDVGIKAINLNTIQTNINQEGNLITEVGSVEFEDGRETQAGNVNFELDRLYSYYNREVELNPEIVGLPWVRGYGFMPDLPIAMSLDNTLLQMVKDAVAETDLTKLKEKFEKIIFRWAGVENITDKEIGVSWAIFSGNDREHRLLHFDGGITLSYEQVGALQKFVGMTPEEVADTVRHRSGLYFLEAWNTMFQGLFTRFVVDAGLLEDVLPAYYDFFTDKIIIDEDFDINAYKSQIKQMISSQDLNQINLAFISMMVLKETNLLEPQFMDELYTDFSKNPEVLINGVLTSPYIDFLFNKVILGTTGNDWLYGINQNDIIWGNSGDDRIYGYDGDDILIGGPGNDYMDGGRGSDTYVFNKGDGQDIIYGDNLDTLKFGKSITKEDLEFSRNANDLVIRIKNSDDSVVFKNWFYSEDLKFGKIEFIDGSILSKEEIESMIDFYTIKGTDKDDVLYGTEEDDTIFGLGGNDRIYGGRGNDILIGGPGNDYLEGGSGSDIYIFNKGDGQDEIIEWLDEPNKTNIVKFGESITKDDISFKREGEDLIVEIKDSSDRIKIFGWFVGENSPKIDRFEFSDGSIITKDEINNLKNIKFSQIKGTDGDDVIFGSYLDEEIYGYGGNDYIYGSHGNDFINAGDGDDFISVNNGNSVVIGDKGNDYICLYGQGEKIVEFNKGEGIDTINLLIWGNSSLKIKFGEGISREDLSYLLKEEGIFIGLKNTEEGIFIKL